VDEEILKELREIKHSIRGGIYVLIAVIVIALIWAVL